MLLPPTDPCLKAHLFSREWLRAPAHSSGCLDPGLLAPIRSAQWLPKVLVVQAGKQGINGGGMGWGVWWVAGKRDSLCEKGSRSCP